MESPEGLNRSRSLYQGFDLKVQDLLVWVPEARRFRRRTEKKAILKGLSFHIKPGTMNVIIGPSGSGKTTLMNFLAGRQDASQMFKTSCKYYVNDTEVKSIGLFKNIIGYVLQDDIMDTRMTPRELFEHYGQFRGIKDYKQTAQTLLEELSLVKCANTVVGDVFVRGISGGEKKRTSIGIELVSNPNLLFLDEPTTGLDSTTALDIIATLGDLRSRGITIISTIHQPSEEIMAFFDKVLLVADGHIIYDDSPKNIARRLQSMGFQIPEFVTSIEYFMKIIDRDDIRVALVKEKGEAPEAEVKAIYDQRMQKFINEAKLGRPSFEGVARAQGSQLALEGLRALARTKNQKINWLRQMEIFLRVLSRLFFKDFFGIIIKTILFWVTFVIFLLVFIKMPAVEDNARIALQNRAGFYFMFLVNMFFAGSNASLTLFLPQKQIYMKDRQSRMYSKFAFFWSNTLYVIPYYFVNVTLAAIIYFYALGLNNDDPGNLAWIWAFIFFGAWLGGSSIGLFISIVANKIEDTNALSPILVLPLFIVAGFFVSIRTMTWPLFLYSFLSPLRFIFQGVILVEFQNAEAYRQSCRIDRPCPDDPSKVCDVLVAPSQADLCDPRNLFNFYENQIWLNFLITMILVFGWRLLAYLIFLVKYRERTPNMGFDQELFDLYCKRQDAGDVIVEERIRDGTGGSNMLENAAVDGLPFAFGNGQQAWDREKDGPRIDGPVTNN